MIGKNEMPKPTAVICQELVEIKGTYTLRHRGRDIKVNTQAMKERELRGPSQKASSSLLEQMGRAREEHCYYSSISPAIDQPVGWSSKGKRTGQFVILCSSHQWSIPPVTLAGDRMMHYTRISSPAF